MIRFNVNAAKSQFFDRLKVLEGLDHVARRGLSKFGAFVRRVSQRSIRKIRRKRKSELSGKELLIWNIRKRIALSEGRPEPPRPYAHSKPGQPPRSITGLLRKHIYFAYDPQARSVVVGPATLAKASGAPRTLEEGGRTRSPAGKQIRIDARPYMKPAFDAELPKLPRMLRGAA